jgi:pimeloyl-ACP methyl ester carboxylesterase
LPESAFLPANGLTLHYLDWGGPRPPALLLHATGFLAAIWGPIAEALSQRYRVLAFDQRGHGDSDKPPSGYHRLDFVADLRAFLDALELEGIVGIGHSA